MKYVASMASSLALAAAMSAVPLHAQAAGSSARALVDISQVKIELIDLTPDDGNTPWIELFSVNSFGSGPLARACVSEGADCDLRTSYGTVGKSSAYSGGSGTITDSAAHAESWINSGGNTEVAWGVASRYQPLTLSPWTTLRITANGTIDAEHTGSGSVWTQLMLGTTLYGWRGSVDWDLHFVSYEDNGNGDFSLSVALSTSEFEKSGEFFYTALAHTTVTAVPEPSTYGMLLAGVGIIGAAVRRKQRA